jgi:hypothetical protein
VRCDGVPANQRSPGRAIEGPHGVDRTGSPRGRYLRTPEGRSRRRAVIPDRVWARAVDRCAPGDYAISSPEFGDIRAVRSETDLNWPIPARRGPVVPGLGATVATRTLGAKSSAIRAYRSRRADVTLHLDEMRPRAPDARNEAARPPTRTSMPQQRCLRCPAAGWHLWRRRAARRDWRSGMALVTPLRKNSSVPNSMERLPLLACSAVAR